MWRVDESWDRQADGLKKRKTPSRLKQKPTKNKQKFKFFYAHFRKKIYTKRIYVRVRVSVGIYICVGGWVAECLCACEYESVFRYVTSIGLMSSKTFCNITQQDKKYDEKRMLLISSLHVHTTKVLRVMGGHRQRGKY